MAKAFQPAVGVHRQVALQREGSRGHIGAGPAAGAEAQVLVDNQLGDGETVMHHRQVNLAARVADAGFLIGRLAGAHRFGEVGKVPVVAHYAESAHRQPQPLDQDVVVAESAGDFRRGDDGGGGPVANPAAIEQTQGPSDHRGVGDLLGAHFPLEVGFGAHSAVVVVFGGDLGQGLLALVKGNAVFVEVAGGGQGELRGRGNRRIYVGTGGFRHRQTGKAGILQLFHAQGQHDVVDPGGYGVAGVAESVGGGGAGVLDAGDGDVIQFQGIGQRLPGAKG